MASRVVSQPNRGEAVPVEGKQKNNGAVEGRNRRALGDIGNLVTVQGVDAAKPNRPLTRSFRAQLIANAQAAAAENNKKPVNVNLDGDKPEKVVARAAQRKIHAKPKPEEVIEISPDTEEKILKDKEKIEKESQPVKVEKARAGSSKKKKVQAYTSVLTARSKAACGLIDKPKENIVDIDVADKENDLAAVEYVEDIYKFYKLTENESRPNDYMDSQPEITERMRAILVDWLIEVHHKFELTPETLYLTINIVDRFLAVKSVPRKQLQLVGISAMLTASKYEEIWAPEVNDFVCISDRAYTHEQILIMEKTILGQLEWTLTVPTLYVFLVRFIKAAIPDLRLENMVYFLAELGMVQYATIMYCPSMVAASAVYAARSTLNMTPVWNPTLKLHTGFSEEQLINCAKLLVSFHSMAAKSEFNVVSRKYSKSERGAVALLPPAKNLSQEI